MRFRPEVRLAVLASLWLAAATAAEALDTAGQAHVAPSAAEIDAAVERGRADPDLGGPAKSRRLRWVGGETRPEPAKPGELRRWLVNLFDFIGRAASLVLWMLGFMAAGILGVWVYRAAGLRAPRVASAGLDARTEIGALDIRPASLPDDIGAAARALLDAGHTRAALSLLYRGALSRAVHRHGIAIGAAATESEVLRAVDGRLDATGVEYFRKLVQLWQHTVYAGAPTGAEAVLPLCARFVAALG